MHALIIEDEYLISRSLQQKLEDLGFTSFSFARSEDAAISAAKDHAIGLIAADVRLLPGDGFRAVDAICDRRQIPVIFITGFAEEIEERAPGSTVIQKPINDNELAAAIRTVLRKES